jgi:hypothetical protein
MATDVGGRTTDKPTEILIDALKQALAEPAEQRLYRSGKLDGLFASRAGANGEAAARAIRDGLLEVRRTETRGKTTVEWVRLTPRGVDFLHEHESPVRALRDLQAVLQTTTEAVPLWLADMRRELQTLSARLAEEAQKWTHRLDALGQRVEEALRRAEAGGPHLPDGVAQAMPWALDALTYLERRQAGGANGDCPLPELFAALREKHAELSLTAFHDGLRRLHDRRSVRLLPFAGPPGELPEPEFALVDGVAVLYYARREGPDRLTSR